VIATSTASRIDRFNGLPESELMPLLASCLDVPRWVGEVSNGRPYDDEYALIRTAQNLATTLTADEVERALSRHPRIGDRAGAGHDSAFSNAEQSGVDATDTAVAAALAAGNAAYERHFDRVFLIRAAGRSSSDILAHLERRLGNSDEAELAEVVAQLGEIAVLRLQQVMAR
jgi:OHCU decarboxylase